MRRRETKTERAAWTALVAGEPEKKPPKYGNERAGKFASKHEADEAAKLDALERCGQIRNLKFQVPLVLVEGRDGVRSVTWIADFRYEDLDGTVHWLDAKGMKTQVYKIKKRLAYLLCGVVIEEL